MPIHEYECRNCGRSLETIQKVTDKPLVDCPRCGKPGLRKKTSLNSFQLKEAGWYRDGYNGKTTGASGGKNAASSSSQKSSRQSGINSPAA